MSAQNWGDLKVRVLSGLVMLLAGGIAVWFAPVGLSVLIWLCLVFMHWELAMMTGADWDTQVYITLAAAVFGLALFVFPWAFLLVLIALCLPLVIGVVFLEKNSRLYVGYGILMAIGTAGLAFVLDNFGTRGLLVVVGVVVLSDIFGYFAGRLLGGPKFWPAISPKKTWSGTLAGWVAAAIFAIMSGIFPSVLVAVIFGVLLAFGAQMGDIVESAMKRKLGVKDSSDLIPGHGGVLDRFDGMIGAGATVMIMMILAVAFL